MKRIKLVLTTALSIIAVFLILHSTPTLALKTHVFFYGYFKEAIITEIVDDELHNKIDKEKLSKENAKCYTLTKPPIEKATESYLRNYKVTKKNLLYFAEYYGDC
ncbi:hypothetical protein QEW_3246 [Clostridioides difficile CD160]|nr:hypothetical protein QEW_3246 [Clostridioides difficile CD160]